MGMSDVVLGEIRKLSKIEPEQITLESRVRELGLDSLDLAELGNELEDALQIELDDSQTTALFSATTVGDIVRAFAP